MEKFVRYSIKLMTKDIKFRNYCWTLNNPTKEEVKKLIDLDDEDVKYTIFGVEEGEKKTPHLQGYSEFNKPIRLKMFKKIMGSERFWIGPRKGTRSQARTYCMKDGTFHEIGEWLETSQGTRSDLNEICKKINSGASLRQLRLSDPGMIVKYNKGLKQLIEMKEDDDSLELVKEELKDIKLHKWQEEIVNILKGKPDKDKIMWYYGEPGLGKSTLKKWILANMEKVTFLDLEGDARDCIYAWKGEKIIIFDIPLSSNMDTLNYKLLEDLKNGVVFSHKYESRSKVYPKPHILVLANNPPCIGALSAYKWDIKELKVDIPINIVPDRKNNIEIPKGLI